MKSSNIFGHAWHLAAENPDHRPIAVFSRRIHVQLWFVKEQCDGGYFLQYHFMHTTFNHDLCSWNHYSLLFTWTINNKWFSSGNSAVYFVFLLFSFDCNCTCCKLQMLVELWSQLTVALFFDGYDPFQHSKVFSQLLSFLLPLVLSQVWFSFYSICRNVFNNSST